MLSSRHDLSLHDKVCLGGMTISSAHRLLPKGTCKSQIIAYHTLHAQHSQSRTCNGLAYDGHKADTSETLPVIVLDIVSYMIHAAGHDPTQQRCSLSNILHTL